LKPETLKEKKTEKELSKKAQGFTLSFWLYPLSFWYNRSAWWQNNRRRV